MSQAPGSLAAPPGSDPARPIYMRLVAGPDGSLSWQKIALMLAVTALSGFLASYGQRAGSEPDLIRSARMRAALASQRVCQAQADFWQRAATGSAQAYQKARP
jgi:hypothetical protein